MSVPPGPETGPMSADAFGPPRYSGRRRTGRLTSRHGNPGWRQRHPQVGRTETPERVPQVGRSKDSTAFPGAGERKVNQYQKKVLFFNAVTWVMVDDFNLDIRRGGT